MSKASQPANQSGTELADTIRASSLRNDCINRPDTRLHPTKPPNIRSPLATREPSTQDVRDVRLKRTCQLAREHYEVAADEPLPSGKVSLLLDFEYDGGGLHKGATVKILVNGKQVAKGRVGKTMGELYSLVAETAEVGRDSYSPVTPACHVAAYCSVGAASGA